MTTRLTTLLTVLLLAAFAGAGCGDDDESGSAGGDTTAETSPATTDEAPPDTTTEARTSDETATDETAPQKTETDKTSTDGSGVAAPPGGNQAVETCKQQVRAVRQVSDEARVKLEDLCEKVGSNDPQEIQEAAREVCRTMAEEAPEGSGREAALAACERGAR